MLRPGNLVLGLNQGQQPMPSDAYLTEHHESFTPLDRAFLEQPTKRLAKRPTNLKLEGELQVGTPATPNCSQFSFDFRM